MVIVYVFSQSHFYIHMLWNLVMKAVFEVYSVVSLIIQVHGLAERRPSVLKGDCLYVRVAGASGKPEGCEYKGYVHDVGPEEVYLGFSQK